MPDNWQVHLVTSQRNAVPQQVPANPLRLPAIPTENDVVLNTIAFAPDDSSVARIVSPTNVILNRFSKGCLGPDQIIHCNVSFSCLIFGPVPQNMHTWGYRGDHTDQPEHLLATGHNNGSIRLWNSQSTRLITTLIAHKLKVTDVRFSPAPTNPLLVTVSADKTVKLWYGEYYGYNMSHSLSTDAMTPYCCDIHLSGQFFAVCGNLTTLKVYNLESDTRVTKLRHKIDGHTSAVVKCVYAKNGAVLLTCSWDTRVNICDSFQGTLLRSLCHVYPLPPALLFNEWFLCDICCDSEFSAVATIDSQGKLTIWDPCADGGTSPTSSCVIIHQPQVEKDLSDHEFTVCTFSQKGNFLLVGDNHGKALVMQLQKSAPDLKHYCRNVICSLVCSKNKAISNLSAPRALQSYLNFEH